MRPLPFLGLLFVVACSAPKPGLPVVLADGDCFGTQHPTLCEYGANADAVVLGTVTAITMPQAPLLSSLGSGMVSDSATCRSIDRPLEISLRVEKVLAGTVGKEITFRVGY